MLPIVNKPLMEHQVELFIRNGVKNIRISSNHLSNKIEEYLDSGSRWGASLSYNFERPPFSFVSALRQMRPYFEGETLVVMQSNVITDIDLLAALEFHWSKRAEATFVCLTQGEDIRGFSIMLDEHARIHAVGTQNQPVTKRHPVDAGICILEPEVLDLLSDTIGYNLLHTCWLANQTVKLNLFGYATDVPFSHVTNWSSYFRVQKAILEHAYPGIIVPGIELQPGVWVGKNVSASSNVSFEAPLVIGDNCRIGKGVVLGGETIIGHDVMVDVGANLRHAVILSKTFVGAQTVVKDSIIQGNLVIDVRNDSFMAIEDRLAALEIERPMAGYRFYVLANRCFAFMLYGLLSPLLLILFFLLIVGLKFPLVTRVRRIAPDLKELAAGKLKLRVFDVFYLGPADLTKQPVGHNPDPLTTLPHILARIGNLTNVIRGDMMLVGNRPMDPEIAFSITEEYRRTRLKCQGGVVSILDTNEVDEGTEEEQVISEGYYAVNRNFWMDMSVLVRGLWRLFWRMVGTRKVVREYRSIPPEESPSFE
jgi:NDP-sugar pyrophosphorylase family protein